MLQAVVDDGRRAFVTLPYDPTLVDKLVTNGVDIQGKPSLTGFLLRYNCLPVEGAIVVTLPGDPMLVRIHSEFLLVVFSYGLTVIGHLSLCLSILPWNPKP